jgi:hypothetical protein
MLSKKDWYGMEIKVLAVEDGIHNKLELSREQYAHLKD